MNWQAMMVLYTCEYTLSESKLSGNLLSFCLDVAQDHMKGATNETWSHLCWFASQAC